MILRLQVVLILTLRSSPMKLEWRQFKATIVLGLLYFRISGKDEIILE
jgi:hypothetical protein